MTAKSIIASALVLVASPWALANQAQCTSVDQDTMVTIEYDPGFYVREMSVYDLTVQPVNQHVATFRAMDNVLQSNFESHLARVVGMVDLANPYTSRIGERIGATRLGQLATIALEIDFSYQQPYGHGMRLAAQVFYSKTTGEQLVQEFDCLYVN